MLRYLCGYFIKAIIILTGKIRLSNVFIFSQVSVSEPQFLNDPASIATLTVVRSSGGEGVVHLIWLLQEEGRDDLNPYNGTLTFNGVGVAGKNEYEYCL